MGQWPCWCLFTPLMLQEPVVGIHICPAKDVSRELRCYPSVIAAWVRYQAQCPGQLHSIDADAAGKAKAQLLLYGCDAHKGYAQAMLHCTLDGLNRIQLLQAKPV